MLLFIHSFYLRRGCSLGVSALQRVTENYRCTSCDDDVAELKALSALLACSLAETADITLADINISSD